MNFIVREVYEIQNIGKGVIENITPNNLLKTKEVIPTPGFQDVLDQDSDLPYGNTVNVNQYFHLEAPNGNRVEVSNTNIISSSIPAARIGKGIGNTLTDVSIGFFPTQALVTDGQNSRGLEYAGDYEANFLPRSLITQQHLLSQISENRTLINAGNNITITGNGTSATPFIISATTIPVQKTITYPADFPSGNYILQNSDVNKLIFIKNGNNNVTITAPNSLPDEFFAAFIRAGGVSGEVTFQGSGATIFSSVGLTINSLYDQVALDKEGSFNQFYLTGNTKV